MVKKWVIKPQPAKSAVTVMVKPTTVKSRRTRSKTRGQLPRSRSASRSQSRGSSRSVSSKRSRSSLRSRAIKVASASVRSNSIKSSVAKTLAMAICLPGSCPNLRLKADPAECQCTGSTSLHSYSTIEQPSTAGTYTNFPSGTSYVALFRDAFRAAIQFTSNPSATAYSYQASFYSGSAIVTALPYQGQTGDSLPLNPLYWTSLNPFSPHGQNLYCGMFDEDLFTWLDFGATVTFTRSVTTNPTLTDTILIVRWDGNVVENFGPALAFVTTGTTVTFTNTNVNGGYFHFDYVPTSTTPSLNTISMILGGTGDVFAHISVPNALTHIQQFTRFRINAASIMTSPVAALINRGGTITAASIEGSNLWYKQLTTTALTSVAAPNTSVKGYELGMYAFLKPGGVSEFSYTTPVIMSGSIPSTISFPLETDFRYVAIILKSDIVGSSSPGEEYLLSLNWDVEYQTSDQWIETHLTSSTYRNFMDATEMLSRIPQFHDNPLHLSDIIGSVRSGYNWVRKQASGLGSWINGVVDIAAPVGRMVGNTLESLPEW